MQAHSRIFIAVFCHPTLGAFSYFYFSNFMFSISWISFYCQHRTRIWVYQKFNQQQLLGKKCLKNRIICLLLKKRITEFIALSTKNKGLKNDIFCVAICCFEKIFKDRNENFRRKKIGPDWFSRFHVHMNTSKKPNRQRKFI